MEYLKNIQSKRELKNYYFYRYKISKSNTLLSVNTSKGYNATFYSYPTRSVHVGDTFQSNIEDSYFSKLPENMPPNRGGSARWKPIVNEDTQAMFEYLSKIQKCGVNNEDDALSTLYSNNYNTRESSKQLISVK